MQLSLARPAGLLSWLPLVCMRGFTSLDCVFVGVLLLSLSPDGYHLWSRVISLATFLLLPGALSFLSGRCGLLPLVTVVWATFLNLGPSVTIPSGLLH